MTDNAETPATVTDWFSNSAAPVDETDFTDRVMAETRALRRRKIARRAMLGLLLAALSIPLQDIGIAVAEVAMVQLVEINNQLAAEVLAPINSVGGVLSAVLLFLRTVYRRLLRG